MHLKRLHRVFVVRGDEDNGNIRADQLQNIESCELGHLHVEEQQVGLVLGDCFYRLQSVLAFGDDFDFLVRAEQFAQYFARQLFVVNDQGTQTSRRLAHVLSPYSAGSVMLTRKRSSPGSTRSVASLP